MKAVEDLVTGAIGPFVNPVPQEHGGSGSAMSVFDLDPRWSKAEELRSIQSSTDALNKLKWLGLALGTVFGFGVSGRWT